METVVAWLLFSAVLCRTPLLPALLSSQTKNTAQLVEPSTVVFVTVIDATRVSGFLYSTYQFSVPPLKSIEPW